MKRLVATVLVGLWVSTGWGSPERPWFPESFQLPPYGVAHYGSRCEPGQPVVAIISGNGVSALGLYVFNAAGQCVAHDDDVSVPIIGDRIVTFTPADAGPYELEVRNFSGDTDQVEAVFRGRGGKTP